MTLGGLWHGANWTFVAWGGLHGLGLVVNHHWRRLNVALPLIIARFFTVAFVMLCFVVFRADNISHAVNVVAPLTGLVNATWSLDRVAALVLAAAAVSVIGPTSQALAGMRVMRHASSAMVLAIVFVAALLWIVQQERYAPFIYFQF